MLPLDLSLSSPDSAETFAQPAKNCQKDLILGAKTTPHVSDTTCRRLSLKGHQKSKINTWNYLAVKQFYAIFFLKK